MNLSTAAALNPHIPSSVTVSVSTEGCLMHFTNEAVRRTRDPGMLELHVFQIYPMLCIVTMYVPLVNCDNLESVYLKFIAMIF